jgi:iron complex transport system substrate-binding protein
MDATLAEAGRGGGDGRTALYLTASGATTGSGTVMHEVLEAAGFENALGDTAGWRMLPLERLVLDPPETIVTGFFDTLATQSDAWSYTRHGALRTLLEDAETAHLSGAQIGCTSWLLAEAALDARRQVEARRVAAAP